jgi:ribosomal protein S18 acetylase RimI-like enzyme
MTGSHLTSLNDLVRLTASHLGPASETLARAFQEDPLAAHLIPSPTRRRRLLPRCFRCAVRYGVRYGEAYATSPDFEGVAVWLPPEAAEVSIRRMLRVGVFWLPIRVGMRFFTRFWSFQRHVSTLRRRRVAFRHWYLQVIGVKPEQHGRGRGSSLIRTMLRRLDAENVPCCLDTETGKNKAIYEHFGFKVLEASTVPGTDIDCWLMAREKPCRNPPTG